MTIITIVYAATVVAWVITFLCAWFLLGEGMSKKKWWLGTAVEVVGYTFGLLIVGIPALAIALLGWIFTRNKGRDHEN